jgi:hypothetical protein
MIDRSVTHATVSLERIYAVSTARVFAAWADPAAKARWFAGAEADHMLDFQVVGEEINRGYNASGTALTFKSRRLSSLLQTTAPGSCLSSKELSSTAARTRTGANAAPVAGSASPVRPFQWGWLCP